jgi:DNA-binding response OmpR family regulator
VAIQALIVDQASGVRSLFARVLRSIGCATHEAADGGEAVELLQASPVHLAVIEAEAPLLSGLELLRVIRESDIYANLPVVLVTSGTDQATLSEMVKLGAADCLTKPFDVELIKMRLQRIVKSISAAGELQTTPSSEPGVSGSALIVDGDAELRQAIAGALMSAYATTQMETGLEALRACQVRKFSVLVMGTSTGLLTPRLLARRLRRQATLENMRIVLVAPPGAEAGDRVAFDAILSRTLAPDALVHQIGMLLAPASAGEAGPIDAVRGAVASAAQQVLGMMAGTDVLPHEAAGSPAEGALEAAVVLTIDAAGTAMLMALRAEGAAARLLASRISGRPESEILPEEAHSSLGELAAMVASRVQSQVCPEAEPESPVAPSLRTLPPEPDRGESPAVLGFVSATGDVKFAIVLTPRRAVEDGTTHADGSALAAIA